MRRKPGTLLPVEVAILAAALEAGPGEEFYGYAIARRIQAGEASRLLTAHGTLYKALDRMLKAGLLAARWEDAEAAAQEERPRRRLYRVTGVGEAALHEEARRQALQHAAGLSEGLQPS
ncbi:MAG: helix-turn-helix transcriptional regulator [Dehalococcoidia bacterium]|nr:helix-turn-helix transcriptional regulator [Dehalococcoidia bacterium]